MFCTRAAWVCLVYLLLLKEEGSSPVSLQLLRGGIWVCMRCPCICVVGFWDGEYVRQLPYVWYYVGINSSFLHGREEWRTYGENMVKQFSICLGVVVICC